jgi:murein DD-endopeptidase MepM/ murein hydrolase activator NlpD
VTRAADAVPGTVLVQPGDTLAALARRVDRPMRALIDANGLQPPYRLVAGQRLRIPAAAPSAPVAAMRVEPPAAAAFPSPVAAAPAGPSQPSSAPVEGSRHAEARPAAATPSPAAVPTVARAARFAWPVQGQVISGFGAKPGGLQNDGINIAAPRGTPVRAAGPGTVVYAGNELRGFGNLLLIRHADGWMSAYAHLDDTLVERGAEVQRGQQIGRVGQTGSVATPQLHFELRQAGRAVDPRGMLPPAPALAAN